MGELEALASRKEKEEARKSLPWSLSLPGSRLPAQARALLFLS